MTSHYTAFHGEQRIAAGTLADVARAIKQQAAEHGTLIFDDATAQTVELDLRGSEDDVVSRLAPADVAPARGPGRPKLGVVPREVTLLPRHWDWLGQQPGGASVALRKLVEEASRASSSRDRIRQAREVAYRFMSATGGNAPHFEEITRALFASDRARFDALLGAWPADLRDYLQQLAGDAFEGTP
jgi:hypothetical protein